MAGFINSPRKVFIFFMVSSILLRLCLILAIEINHDESTYLVIANEWLKGGIPFVHYSDIKPIGIYAIFASVIAVFGQSIIAIRLFTAIVVALTAFLLFRAKQKEGASDTVALLSGLFYLLLLTIHFWGWTGNTEIFFNLLTAASLFILLSKTTIQGAFAVGLLMGIGFNIKYLVLFDCFAFALYFLYSPKLNLGEKLLSLLAMGIGGVFPFLLVNLYYLAIDQYEAFAYVTFVLPARYKAATPWIERFGFIIKFYFYSLPLAFMLIASYLAIYKKRYNIQHFWVLRIAWPAFIWFVISLTGKTSNHYFLQVVIPFSFFAFDFIDCVSTEQCKLKWQKGLYILAVVIALVGVMQQYFTIYAVSNITHKNRSLRASIQHMKDNLKENDIIYTRRMILHFVLDSSPIQKFIHPSLYTDERYQEVFSINTKETFDAIKARNPAYCFTTRVDYPLLADYLSNNYKKVATYENGDILWERAVFNAE